MYTLFDIIYTDGFIRFTTNGERYFVTASFGDDESTTETTAADMVTTLAEARDESANCECTICVYNHAMCLA